MPLFKPLGMVGDLPFNGWRNSGRVQEKLLGI